MDDQTGPGRVIDLRAARSGGVGSAAVVTGGAGAAERRILELAGPTSDPGWIAGLLNREGLPSPRNRPWSPEDVLAVLSHRSAAPA